jgi:hypothetical protein
MLDHFRSILLDHLADTNISVNGYTKKDRCTLPPFGEKNYKKIIYI